MTFVVYFLAMHPPVLTRLRQEILDVVGPTERPDFGRIKEMKYLRAVINESLRLLPPVPFNSKYTVESTTLTDPQTGVKHFIPKGTRVALGISSMQRSTDYWGPDAVEFQPERWLDDRNAKYYLANPFIFLPFLAGPRICLGQQFAYNEVSFFLVRLLQRFEHIELAPDAHPEGTLPPAEWKDEKNAFGTRAPYEKIWPTVHLTMYSKGGMWIRIK